MSTEDKLKENLAIIKVETQWLAATAQRLMDSLTAVLAQSKLEENFRDPAVFEKAESLLVEMNTPE